MLTCREMPRGGYVKIVARPLMYGLAREYFIVRIGMSNIHKPGEDIQWCSECERYFNPKAPHECVDKRIRENQRSLETFLGRYKVVEES